MLSSHQIYQDYKENSCVLSSKERKLSSIDKPKNLGLKISTNISKERSSNSDSSSCKKNFPTPIKKPNEQKIKSTKISKKESSSLEAQDEWPEIENMFIYEDPEDNYEDILPISARFTQREIDCFFRTSCIRRQVELSDDEDPPDITLEKIDLIEDFSHPTTEETDLYYDTPFECIPEPSFDDMEFI